MFAERLLEAGVLLPALHLSRDNKGPSNLRGPNPNLTLQGAPQDLDKHFPGFYVQFDEPLLLVLPLQTNWTTQNLVLDHPDPRSSCTSIPNQAEPYP